MVTMKRGNILLELSKQREDSSFLRRLADSFGMTSLVIEGGNGEWEKVRRGEGERESSTSKIPS